MPRVSDVRRALFIEGVAAGKSHVQAYRAAGYSGSDEDMAANAARLLRDPAVAGAIARHLATAAEAAGINAEWWVRRVVEVVNDPKANHLAKLKGLELLGRKLQLLGNDQPATVERTFVLIAPAPAATPEQWVQAVRVQAEDLAAQQAAAALEHAHTAPETP